MLDLRSNVLVFGRWLPVTHVVLDEMDPFVEAVKFDKSCHMLLRRVYDQFNFGFFWLCHRSFELFDDPGDVQIWFGSSRFVSSKLGRELVALDQRLESVALVDGEKLFLQGFK